MAEIGILTVIPTELHAMRRELGLSSYPEKLGSTNFWQGFVYSEREKRQVAIVLAAVGTAGNPESSTATTEMILRFNPKIVLLVGIAAGIRSQVKIGDVVLSERIWAYEGGVLGVDRDTPRPESWKLPESINQDIVAYLDAATQTRLAQIGPAMPAIPQGKEEEYEIQVAKSLAVKQATIASGEKLLKDPSVLQTLRENDHGRIEAGEMEGNGFATACHRLKTDWLVVRGISDFGDQFKSDHFQIFAAQGAAKVTADFIRCGLAFGHSPSPAAATTPDYRPLDRATLERYLQLMTPTGSLDFIKNNNFAGFSFDGSRLDGVRRFIKEAECPTFEFLTHELQEAFLQVKQSFERFLSELQTNAFPVGDGFYSIPSEFEITAPQRFEQMVTDVHTSAARAYAEHVDFVRLARRVLA